MYKVYWTEVVIVDHGHIKTTEKMIKSQDLTELTDMLKCCEELRKRRRAGEPISFITSVSENPDVVGEAGAADVGEDYSWTKRRGGRDREQKTGKPNT